MNATIKIRIVRRCMVDATTVGEVADIVELDVPSAANMMGYGGGIAVDPAAAAEAIKAWNANAVRTEQRSQPVAATIPFVGKGRH